MILEFEQDYLTNQDPVARVKVIGVGGAGGNTVNHMISAEYENVEFIALNTDAQSLKLSKAPIRIQIGARSAKGLGAGANPEKGKVAAEEDIEKLAECVKGANIVFITAGLGGGTGSGAAPVVARILREMGILSVAVVTKPFAFEGKRRMTIANQALENLKKEVDTLIVIPNQRLLDVADTKVSLINAFGMINDVIHQFVKSIADIISRPGHINVDFADVCTIMRNRGLAVMGTGRASGPERAQQAAMQAISSPLLENASIKGARAVLLNITGSSDLGLHEVHSAASIVYDQAEDANIIMGSVVDDSMGDEVQVTIIATGVDRLDHVQSVTTQASQQVNQIITPLTAAEVSMSYLRPAQSAQAVDVSAESKLVSMGSATAQTAAAQSEQPLSATERLRRLATQEKSRDAALKDIEIPAFLRRIREKELSQK